jgi:calmodulin
LIQLIIDADGGGTIGLEELENPLIGLGFAENREDVQELIKTIDEDDNGDIDFGEF